MRMHKLHGALILLLLLSACTDTTEITTTGPSVPDQLNSRGYVAAPRDSVTPVDTLHLAPDTLR